MTSGSSSPSDFNSNQQTAPTTSYRFLPIPMGPGLLVLISALVFTALYNAPFYQAIYRYLGPDQPLLIAKLVFLLFLINHFLASLFSFRLTLKPVLVFLLLAGSLSSYFMSQYGILIDRSMLQNAVETDINEVLGLLSWNMVTHMILYFVLPLFLLSRVRLRWSSGWRSLAYWGLPLAADLALVLGLALSSYDEMASTFRNHRDLKSLAVPVNSVAAMGSLASRTLKEYRSDREFVHIGTDAQVVPAISNPDKPNLVIFVLGETARGDHFALNGYPRDTTPELSHLHRQPGEHLVNFSQTSSCGTATALSVPCMFTRQPREHYDEALAKNSDNFLDIMTRAGISTLWIENNSGCKGMCDRITTLKARDPDLCQGRHCSDLALLSVARQHLEKPHDSGDRFIVLHQLGSHGPEYYKRSLPEQKHFHPECESNELQRCERDAIVNAYDNTIRATDQMLAATVRLLKSLADRYHTAMVYISDHGESLGENGLYLHGMPYFMAPAAQTHVPMVMWFSQGFVQTNRMDIGCLHKAAQQPHSHDNLFTSMLSLMNVRTDAIQTELDIFDGCRLL